MYISYRKKVSSWAICYTTREHNHTRNPDQFVYFVNRSRRVEQDKARELARGLRGEVSYKKAQRILKNHDLIIERKKFYNLTRKKTTRKPKPQEELTLLLACLDQEGFCISIHDVYPLNHTGKC